MKHLTFLIFLTFLLISCKKETQTKDFLPSWNDGTVKSSIVNFVKSVTDPDNTEFIKKEDRIVTFDNDGTLWVEQPLPTQMFFAFDRIKELSKNKPKWKKQQPFKAILEGDTATIASFHTKEALQIVLNANAIDDVEKFDVVVNDWLKTAQHPTFNKPYTDLVYQPMLELLNYLQVNDFKIYIVSGGSLEFMRAWASELYGIPSEQIIGTTLKTQETIIEGKPVVQRLSELEHNDDHEGKVISIEKIIGKKPVMVVGNSDGDLEMMQYAFSGKGSRFIMYLNHTDEDREFLYDKDTKYGVLKKGIIEAEKNNWTVIDMKNDWKIVYPFQKTNTK